MDVDVKHSRDLHFYYMAFSSLLYFPFISFSVVLTMFQLALLLLQWLWTPSKDDPMMFFAITFIWGTTSASWDFLILGKRLKNSFKKSYSENLKKFFGRRFFHEWNEGKIHNSTFKSQNQMLHLHMYFSLNLFWFFLQFYDLCSRYKPSFKRVQTFL